MTIERFHEGPRMSQAVTYNGIAYPSGQTAGDAGDDVQSQTRAVLKKIGDRANTKTDLSTSDAPTHPQPTKLQYTSVPKTS